MNRLAYATATALALTAAWFASVTGCGGSTTETTMGSGGHTTSSTTTSTTSTTSTGGGSDGGPVCGQGETSCNGSCVKLGTDPDNCNGCGATCTAPPGGTATCTSGACGFTCTNGKACGASCVDTTSDAAVGG